MKTILEYTQDFGMSVGLVSTIFIMDATTAAFGAHVESNTMGGEVASQFLDHQIDVIFGGGKMISYQMMCKGVIQAEVCEVTIAI